MDRPSGRCIATGWIYSRRISLANRFRGWVNWLFGIRL